MATWVEDIEQALKNLGGQATLSLIYEEVKRIRKDPLPTTWTSSIRERIEAHSSDSHNFKGKDIFRKVGRGTWALREQNQSNFRSEEKAFLPSNSSSTESVLSPQDENVPKNVPVEAPKLWREAMDNKSQEYIIDNGLFSSDVLNFPLSESFDTVANLFRTIKEYRDYVHPGLNSWEEYILEFFHILGFNTTKVASRLITIDTFDVNSSTKALVGIIHQDESLDDIIPGIDWASYIFYASKHFNTEWGILTNGCELRIIKIDHSQNQEASYWCNLDGIIKNDRLDSFFAVYKALNFVKGIRSLSTRVKMDLPDTLTLRREFWTQLLEKAKSRTSLHKNRTPGTDHWISTGAGKTGIEYSYVIRLDDSQIEIYIDRGDYNWNKEAFRIFHLNKDGIENAFGDELEWQLLEDKRASRIRFVFENTGLKNQTEWPALQDKLIDAMTCLDKAFRPFFNKLPK